MTCPRAGFGPYNQSYLVPLYMGRPPDQHLSAEPAGSPLRQPSQHHSAHPILAMDVLKARIMEAAPGEVQGVISSVQFVPRWASAAAAGPAPAAAGR